MKQHSLVLLSVFICLSTLNASVSQGKEVYKKQCQQCHNYARALAGSKSSDEWKKVFDQKDAAGTLAQMHFATDTAKASWKDYFNSTAYTKEAKHLQDFMLKYSSDRGQHNSCN